MKRLIFILCFILGIVCFFAGRMLYVHVKTSQQVFIPHAVAITLHPPKNALQANITSIKGNVEKEGRTDIDFKPIATLSAQLQQGESVRTGDTGSAVLTIPQITDVSIKQQSQLDYLNGLSNALVVRQPKGTITYTTEDAKPFSVRSLGLLVQLARNTNATINTDADAQTVAVDINSGLATLAYSDANNNTQVSTASAGQRVLFDYSQQTLTTQ